MMLSGPSKKEIGGGMDCIVVGGPANGVLLKKIRVDAEMIELRRPDYIKPLESSFQDRPEIAHEKGVYEVHPLSLKNTGEHRPHLFGIAVIEGQSLTWAFTQLVVGYVENYTQQLLAEGIIQKQ